MTKRGMRDELMLAGSIVPVLGVVWAMVAAFGYFAQTNWLFVTGASLAAWNVLSGIAFLTTAWNLAHRQWRESLRSRSLIYSIERAEPGESAPPLSALSSVDGVSFGSS